MFKATIIFILAGIAEIGGGYFIWKWLRDDWSGWFGLAGGISLILYGIIATWQAFPDFGRVYAAYGGVFIIMSLFWGWLIDKETPDFQDWLGSIICLVGVIVIVWPRS